MAVFGVTLGARFPLTSQALIPVGPYAPRKPMETMVASGQFRVPAEPRNDSVPANFEEPKIDVVYSADRNSHYCAKSQILLP
jgi:hypothetical protein